MFKIAFGRITRRCAASSPQVDEPRSADNAERTAPRASQVHHKARENLRQQREMHSPLSILAWRITIVVCLGAVMVTFMMSDSGREKAFVETMITDHLE